MNNVIIFDNEEFITHDYLFYGKNYGGGSVAASNILFLLKDKELKVSNFKKKKENTDCVFLKIEGLKVLYLRKDLLEKYSSIIENDPILSLDFLEKVENKWKKESVKKFLLSKNHTSTFIQNKMLNSIKKFKINFSDVEIDEKELKKTFNKEVKRNKLIF